MSSTNRSNSRDSHILDYYVTPITDVELFLNEFNKRISLDWTKMLILDPCGGGNQEVRDKIGIKELYHPMTYPKAINNVFGNCKVNTIDIREDSLADIKDNYLNMKLKYKPDIIITNPPFAKAIDIITKAMHDIRDDGYVIMLLRLNFFGSKERKSFFESYMPEWCFVHHKRIGFCDKKTKDGYVEFDKSGTAKRGATDSIEYAHFVFRKGYNKDYTKLVLI